MAAKKKGDKEVRDVAALRALDIAELRDKLVDEREELMRTRFRHAAAALEKTSELKARRRQVARIATILKEKEQRA